eukprot:GCRY01001162.1.p1 GENE.GCRY01001162.1~~GCRY01001162.1.p1  ORF type:complete len:313 (+),score=67.80 GCRY01001162.1:270-1208(+)
MSAQNQLEKRFLELCFQHPQGVTDEVLAQHFGSDLQSIVGAINSLLVKGRLTILKNGNANIYRAISEENALKFGGLSAEDMLLYQLIEKSGNMGIWTRDLRHRSGLQQLQLNKALKILESRKLVKSIKSVASKNKKVYMLYDLEPAKELTGGAFYSEQEFDAQFVEVVSKLAFMYIKENPNTTTANIHSFVQGHAAVQADLKLEDVHTVLQTLVYDNLILCIDPTAKRLRGAAVSQDDGAGVPGSDPAKEAAKKAAELKRLVGLQFRALPNPVPNSALTSTPCGVCPVYADCEETGPISPATCAYFEQWLAF